MTKAWNQCEALTAEPSSKKLQSIFCPKYENEYLHFYILYEISRTKCKSVIFFYTYIYMSPLNFQGGSVIRLFHKELEAYLVAEGLFDNEITEDGKIV